jgi:uncharacterized protein YdeI (YjbR/CyaY-like superfamily)
MSKRKKTPTASKPQKTAKLETAKPEKTELPVLGFADPGAWAAWLASNHASSRGLWLKIGKKDAGHASITYAEAIEGALVWGWIDGQKGSIDEAWWRQRFTPRGPKSPWSKINCEKAEALIASGTMMPPGRAAVESARRDGRWDAAYASQSRAVVPPDLAAALAKDARAARFFETLEAYNRYAILYRVHTAKKAETRAARIARFVGMLSRGEKIHP